MREDHYTTDLDGAEQASRDIDPGDLPDIPPWWDTLVDYEDDDWLPAGEDES